MTQEKLFTLNMNQAKNVKSFKDNKFPIKMKFMKEKKNLVCNKMHVNTMSKPTSYG